MNIVQVNYVLAGISNCGKDAVSGLADEKKYAWDNLMSSFGSYERDFSDQLVKICRDLSTKKKPWDPDDDAFYLFSILATIQVLAAAHPAIPHQTVRDLCR